MAMKVVIRKRANSAVPANVLERVLRGELPGEPEWDLRHAYRLFVQLVLTRDAVYKARQKELSETGLTAEQNTVLGAIDFLTAKGLADRITPAEMARLLFRESQSISELLERMQRDGLIRKVKDLPRRNMVRVELTDKGREARDATRHAEVVGRIMSHLSAEQRTQLSGCLDIVRLAAVEELGVGAHSSTGPFSPPRERVPRTGTSSGTVKGQALARDKRSRARFSGPSVPQ